eukprot:TRINITY_DN953_c0_g3_i4.p1 TRINITY_DN953_c0_g3~~TRINITY_DN953_c0_g3_i4.p1  ORF type:complete len:288 (-),score=48.50 TRINITY_DN953_c0_g3_i4:61-924(-)
MNYSYKRYWEPSTSQALQASLGVGAVGTALFLPLDLLKVRIQQRAEGIGIRQKNFYAGYNFNRLFRQIHETGVGMKGFYVGLTTAIWARSSHLFVRNLVYKTLYDKYKPPKPTNDLTGREKQVISGIAGGVAAIVSNPFDLILTRQQADRGFLPEYRRNIKGVLHGIARTIREGSVSSLYNGLSANILRAVILNVSLTRPYDYMKESMWIMFGDTYFNIPTAAFCAALISTTLSLPLDNIRTRMQLAFKDPAKNRINYSGLIDCYRKATIIEGYEALLVGYLSLIHI